MAFDKEKLRTLMKEQSLTVRELAKRMGVSVGVVSEWRMNTSSKEPSPKNRDKLAKALGVSESEFFGGVPQNIVEEFKQSKTIKLFGTASAGPIHQFKKELTIDYPKHAYDEDCEWVRVTGDSMIPLAKKGDYIVVNKTITTDSYSNAGGMIRNGDLCYINILDKGCFFKKYFDLDIAYYKNFSEGCRREKLKQRDSGLDMRCIMLLSINDHELPQFYLKEEVVFCYKVVKTIRM